MAGAKLMILFEPTMKNIIKKCSQNELKSAAKLIRAAYSKNHVGTQVSAGVVYDDDALRGAYLYLFGPLHTALVSLSLTYLQEKWDDFDEWFTKTIHSLQDQRAGPKNVPTRLHICSLGGGPGLETGCVYMWLETLVRDWIIQHRQSCFDCLQLTVCDINYFWKSLFYDTVNSFRNCVIGSTKARAMIGKLHLKYLSSDLLAPSLTKETLETIRDCDLVLMIKFISAVSKQKRRCQVMFDNVIRAMKQGALLLIVDGGHEFNKLLIEEAAQKWNMHRILEHEEFYKSKQDFHSLWKQTYGEYFGHMTPMSACKIIIRVLQKPHYDLENRQTFGRSAVSNLEARFLQTKSSENKLQIAATAIHERGSRRADHQGQECKDKSDAAYHEDMIRNLATGKSKSKQIAMATSHEHASRRTNHPEDQEYQEKSDAAYHEDMIRNLAASKSKSKQISTSHEHASRRSNHPEDQQYKDKSDPEYMEYLIQKPVTDKWKATLQDYNDSDDEHSQDDDSEDVDGGNMYPEYESEDISSEDNEHSTVHHDLDFLLSKLMLTEDVHEFPAKKDPRAVS